MEANQILIKFKNQEFTDLRNNLLADLSHEYYACLLAKRQQVENLVVFTVAEVVYPHPDYYKIVNRTYLHIDGKFMDGVLNEINHRIDVDTVIEVHTHPFSSNLAQFSSQDNRDEEGFSNFLSNLETPINYASIVLSQTQYSARYWKSNKTKAYFTPAIIRTQKLSECILSTDDREFRNDPQQISEMFNRSVLALGLENMRAITQGQKISIVGVGGIGSIIAEHLIHMGFNVLNLIDFDVLEISNLNRIVAATYSDAENKRLKVDAIRENLLKINPKATINSIPLNVFDKKVEYILAKSDWIFIATDNHASRYQIQKIAFDYYVPFIAVGVNITVTESKITDMSGEVILVRMGDRVCLNCLKRMNYDEIAKELSPDPEVREGLVRRGYVTGKDVKEPAVKTLNTHLATMAVDVLVNQYTERRRDPVILVYEDNQLPTIYEDESSVITRNLMCNVCSI